MMLVVLIIALLFAFSVVNLGHPQQAANISTTVDMLLADIKTQQILAMSGNTGTTSAAQPHGLYLQTSQFVLFSGSSYSSSATDNFTESLPSTIQLTTTIPSAQLIFVKGTGEVQGFTAGSNTITLTGPALTRTLTISRFGAVTVN